MPNRVNSPCTFPGCGGKGVFSGRCVRHKRGGTVQRGYGTEHKRLRASYELAIAQGRIVTCWRCLANGVPAEQARILPGDEFDLGHDDHDRRKTCGPEHVNCNRSAAAKLRNA